MSLFLHFRALAASGLGKDRHAAFTQEFLPAKSAIPESHRAAELGVGWFLLPPFNEATIQRHNRQHFL